VLSRSSNEPSRNTSGTSSVIMAPDALRNR